MKRLLSLSLVPALAVCLFLSAAHATQAGPVYVGAASCESCHEEQYAGFMKNSSKARSWKSVAKMLPKLAENEKADCYACHTTGYGAPGGFQNIETTPHMANLGCETCHGPGSLHAESGDPDDIQRKPDVNDCTRCHNAERINNFNFKPMLYHGGH